MYLFNETVQHRYMRMTQRELILLAGVWLFALLLAFGYSSERTGCIPADQAVPQALMASASVPPCLDSIINQSKE